jgi:hypothetical protein
MTLMTRYQAYALLGLSEDCDQAELTKAYHEFSRRHHPDTGTGDSQFQARLNEAREIVAAHLAGRNAAARPEPRPAPHRSRPPRSADAASCAAELARALGFADRVQIVPADLSFRQARLPFLNLYGVLDRGDAERRRSLIARAIDHDLLQAVNLGDVAAAGSAFRLTFRPSLFAPRPDNIVPASGPLTFNEAVGVGVPVLIPAIVCGLIAFYVYPSNWAWLLGAFAACLGIGSAAIISTGVITDIRRDGPAGTP